MKRAFLVFVVMLITGIIRGQVLTPIQLNDKLTDITDSLYARGGEWGEQFKIAKEETRNFAALRPYRERLQVFIRRKIAEVAKMQDVNNSKPLRMAMIDFLQFEMKMTTNAFLPVEKLKSSATDAEIEKVRQRIVRMSEGEAPQLNKVAAAQSAYAAENGFRIETEEEAKKGQGE